LEPDVHEPRAREVGVGKYRDHWNMSTYLNGGYYPGRLVFRKYDILHRRCTPVHFAHGQGTHREMDS
jgi:hypothetical protein